VTATVQLDPVEIRTTCSEQEEHSFLRGDSNANGALGLDDGIVTLDLLFLCEPTPGCGDAADADDNGAIEPADVEALGQADGPWSADALLAGNGDLATKVPRYEQPSSIRRERGRSLRRTFRGSSSPSCDPSPLLPGVAFSGDVEQRPEPEARAGVRVDAPEAPATPENIIRSGLFFAPSRGFHVSQTLSCGAETSCMSSPTLPGIRRK